MRSKQINFFMMPEDLSEFESFLKKRETVFLDIDVKGGNLRFLDSFVKIGDKDIGIKILLTPKRNLNQIIVEYIADQGQYYIDELKSPVIEFIRCFYDFENKKIKRGRLYFKTGYYDDRGEWVSKDQSFLNWADEVFKWFRKNFKNQKIKRHEGFLITPRTAEWIEKEGGKLLEL